MKEDVIAEYGDSTIEIRNAMAPCKMRITQAGISYKVQKSGKVENLNIEDMDVVNWQRLASGYGIRIFTKTGALYRFGGFRESDESKIEKIFKEHFNKKISNKEFSMRGWNYGKAVFDGDAMNFIVGSTPAFEIPLNNVSDCQVGKNEVTLEFHQPDECPTNLMEMRFHIPPSDLAGDEDPVEAFQKKVMEKASVVQATGITLVIFQEINLLVPRGRYDIKIYPSTIQLHGKSFNFNISVDSVQKLFLLPHMDGIHHLFLVSLDPPIKQGQTRYQYVIMQFPADSEEEIELPLTEEEIKEKYDGRLEKTMEGPQFEIVSRVFKGICAKKIVAPGNFLGYSGYPCVGCSYKAAAGYLYALERGFIYCYKPVIHIRNEEIITIHFARSESTTRSFDVEIEIKNDTVLVFSSIEKGEYQRLYEHCKMKKLKVKSSGNMNVGSKMKTDLGEDHYMNRVKADAPSDDEDESTDEDFAPGEEGSDVAEEFDSEAPDSSDSDASAGSGSSPKKEKKDRPPKKAKTVSEKPRKRRTVKKGVKDENKPKRPQSAYFIWLNENREDIKDKNPGISITEISKKAGEMWREISDKTEWEEKAAEAKKQYEIAMKEYVDSGAAAAFAAGLGSDDDSKSSKKTQSTGSKATKSKKAVVTQSPTKAGSGGNFKSKEFLESDESSGEDDDESNNKSKKNESEAESGGSDEGDGSDEGGSD